MKNRMRAMRWGMTALAVLALCGLASAVAFTVPPAAAYAESAPANATPYAPDRFVVQYRADLAGYEILNFDTSDAGWTGMTAEQKARIAIVIPDVYQGDRGELPVVAIGEQAFSLEPSLSRYSGCDFTALDLSGAGRLVSIGAGAFDSCEKITGALTIPDSVTMIGENAFSGCSNLQTVYLPDDGSGGTTYATNVFGGVGCPIVAPSKAAHTRYKTAGHPLSGYNNLTYELTITFNGNGGTVGGSATATQTKLFHYSIKMTLDAHGVWAEDAHYRLPAAGKAEYAFVGFNSRADGGALSAETLLSGAILADTPLVYYAQYAEILVGVAAAGRPDRTEYAAYETFDPTGLTVTAHYQSGASATLAISAYGVRYAGGNDSLRAGETSVTIVYTENGAEKTATVTGLLVAKKRLAAPTVTGSYTYDGGEQTATLADFDESRMTVAGHRRTDAGTQNVTVALRDPDNCEWTNGSTAPLTLAWTIRTLKVTEPAADARVFTYTGEEQTYAVTANDRYTVTGRTRINAGEQTVTVQLRDKENTEWARGGTENLTFAFAIAKAAHDMRGAAFGDVTVKEDGTAYRMEVAGLPPGVRVAAYTGTNGYTAAGVSAPGVYEVTATFAVTDGDNYEVPAPLCATLTINYARLSAGAGDDGAQDAVVVESARGWRRISYSAPRT